MILKMKKKLEVSYPLWLEYWKFLSNLAGSSIEHGGTRPFSNMWEFLLKLQFGIFMRLFVDGNLCVGLLVARGFIRFPLHMTMVWYLANGAGIPGTDQCHCYLRKQTSISVDQRGWGIPD